MDFSKIDTAADAQEGAILHFVHPQLRHPLYTGPGANEYGIVIDKKLAHEPVTALVRGMDSGVVRAEATRMEKVRLRNGKADDAALTFLRSLIIELNGISDGERKITTSEKDLKWLFDRADDMGKQVLAFAAEASNFFKGALPA